jgi:lysine 2,3-aminomutase
MKATFITSIDQITELSAEEKDNLKPITDQFVFRSNDYY